MESTSAAKRLRLSDLQRRIIQALKLKLDNGEFTERGLAKASGISQPQVHNLLKGARRLNWESADTLLDAANLSVLDLLTDSDLYSRDRAAASAHPHTLLSKAIPAISAQQLPLPLEAEACHRKNPASAGPPPFGLTKRAS